MRFVMKEFFLPFLLLSLFTTTRAGLFTTSRRIVPLRNCPILAPFLEPCKNIFQTGNLTDPSLNHCCQGLNIINVNAHVHGSSAMCKCVQLIVITANATAPSSVTVPRQVRVMTTAKLEEECGLNLRFPGFLLSYRCFTKSNTSAMSVSLTHIVGQNSSI
ncbi:hypothetical protein SO802_020331 [Lithocarpus litseifolius]|uniref:Bifunctional inhibitor/plant lipid transfer protein/seed storage helical domain-containing protein n=1 Tax=Lithocarpus litseifolius TaxID=425828 RepID=A0AAW2CBH9_9ROSI